ncbi:MAG: hypothetical protein Q8K79_18255 [Solirubrobacteraceae bacterium]|nr:hypothetical protein [Solirubrobacteraceae bacterium]
MRPWSSLHAPRRTCVAALIAALVVSSCGGASTGNARALSEADYLVVAKRVCLEARQAAKHAERASAVPAVYLRRSAKAAESIQREFRKVHPPPRFAASHRESLRLGEEQIGLIRTALARLQTGADDDEMVALEARNRRLLRRSNELAHEIGLPDCVRETTAP